jgi:DNA-binding transcriptional regulator YiaG
MAGSTFTGAQCVAVRTMLGWTTAKLSRVSGVRYALLTAFEHGQTMVLSDRMNGALVQCFHQMGIGPAEDGTNVVVWDPARLPVSPRQTLAVRERLEISSTDFAALAQLKPLEFFEWERGRVDLSPGDMRNMHAAIESLGAVLVFDGNGPSVIFPEPQAEDARQIA